MGLCVLPVPSGHKSQGWKLERQTLSVIVTCLPSEAHDVTIWALKATPTAILTADLRVLLLGRLGLLLAASFDGCAMSLASLLTWCHPSFFDFTFTASGRSRSAYKTSAMIQAVHLSRLSFEISMGRLHSTPKKKVVPCGWCQVLLIASSHHSSFAPWPQWILQLFHD